MTPNDKLKTLVFEALGAASMCWNPLPGHQVFESEKAQKIGDDLIAAITALSKDAAIQQEPIGWVDSDTVKMIQERGTMYGITIHDHGAFGTTQPIYAHPQPATQPQGGPYILSNAEQSVLNKTLMRSVVRPVSDKAAELTDSAISDLYREADTPRQFARACIAADRALRADTKREACPACGDSPEHEWVIITPEGKRFTGKTRFEAVCAEAQSRIKGPIKLYELLADFETAPGAQP